ncbi:flagellar basal body M-ring protein FliF [Trinickia dabaoshanensis]|uniref:Flagellar M-ring protein n=1 Tax=Trinickia dabaoshanensis TaxID=564714 RepID=A0A2N7VZB2_9BURK|nr:flagellar basal-body MS-ring/collar protein FliF [Trinickia dabaoshanensis]PMS22470.1 flagellar basal body M-ring protein FliF [Trinickia dabaoshanensis]
MDSQANSLINPDARMGLASAQPGAAAAGALQGAGVGAAGGAEFGGFAQRLSSLSQMRGNPRAPLIVAVAVVVAIVTALVLWSRTPDYHVLYSGLSDQDGGTIIAALQQANVPYKLSEGGTAILVPSDQVNDVRLKLASQGLPKSGSVGMELMDNEKFGISQFAEQVNYQRALEGELERTIQSISVVRQARVHLAIPKPTVFVRDREAPTASVLVNLYPGRVLDEGQVSAITHMVASSVSDLPVKNVTIVDQDGTLLTQSASLAGLDASQLKYVQQVEHNTQQRIDAILAPLFGAGNAHAQVSADIDFSQQEQTAEVYGPNGNPQQAAIRSQQTSQATDMTQSGASGVPGALSNTPPQPASAPLAVASGAQATAGVTTTPISERKDATTNYELDKHVSHVEQAKGGVKRLSAAVVINYQRVVDAKGHASMQPLTPEKLAQVTQLVKDAMGYDAKRGDSVNIVNATFETEADPLANLPWWKQPQIISLAIQAAKWLGIGLVALVLYLLIIKPAMRRAFPPPSEAQAAENSGVGSMLDGPGEPVLLDGGSPSPVTTAMELDNDMEQNLLAFESEKHKFERNLDYARTIARKDPKIVATVVKNWVSDER